MRYESLIAVSFCLLSSAGAERVSNSESVITHDFWRDPEKSPNIDHGHHWCGNAESYFLIGNAPGKAIIELVEGER